MGAPFDRWPLGINKAMDDHASYHGLSHWCCTSPDSNDFWVRRDGLNCKATFRGPNGYLDDLRAFDQKKPMHVIPPPPWTRRN